MDSQIKSIGELVASLRQYADQLTRDIRAVFRAGGQATARSLAQRVETFNVLEKNAGLVFTLLHSLTALERALEEGRMARNRVVNSPAFRSQLTAN